jgi:hypothetical protein
MGGAVGTGVLRCAQDDGKNKQQQEQTTAKTSRGKTSNGKNRSRSPLGMTTKQTPRTSNGKDKGAVIPAGSLD